MILSVLAQAANDTQHIRWTDLGLDPMILNCIALAAQEVFPP